MIGPELFERITRPEFQPFTLVLANGDRIEVRHRDSIGFPSVEASGKRIFTRSVHVLETRDGAVFDRIISIPLIAQILDRYDINGPNGIAKAS